MNDRSNTIGSEVQHLLRQWLGPDLPIENAVKGGRSHSTLLASFGDVTLVISIARSDSIGVLDITHQALMADSELFANVPIVAVPYMGPKARIHLRDRGVSWLDLSGNADIRGPGIRILIEGKPNRFTTPGRPSTLFSPKASRLSRALLVESERWWLQNELATATALSAGYVSKIIHRMDDDALIARHPDDARLRPAAPDLLLDTWAQAHDFRRNDIHRYHAIGRTGEATLRTLTDKLTTRDGIRWAATGLAAAWQYSRYADFRLTTLYVEAPLLRPEDLGLRPVERGENVWIVTPKDEGVFYGAQDIDGIPCVHPVQCYLDLLAHPERAREAAAHLRERHLPWSPP